MIKGIFSQKKKYATVPPTEATSHLPNGLISKCPKCKKILYNKELNKNFKICSSCQHYFPMSAPERINFLLDKDSFIEYDAQMISKNPLDFPQYTKKLKMDGKNTNLLEAIVTGEGSIKGYNIVIAVMDIRFRMGSMGSVVGEKIALAMERAISKGIPFIIFTASGGARMQEGVISLMQMAKTSSAAKMLDLSGNLFISVMTSPTTGGVSASFASLGDYNFAEPGALIGFAGRRIIEQTIREELPKDFQTAEFLLEHGQLDRIISRHTMRDTLGDILSIHQGG
ncbi:acetyl-CoA carboxylase, carboxyltransferase subunit beta [Priestia aryabhattai]|uniref:acetyl-CoA carboxylase, carboxyltransferase subunit beta n=1 Tax=Priestia aryabhattai TaxID=412384 RepID=UPI0018737047|nr:acetyl-CoA carboxylase, carboxyltransferase subunit beta [Priestia aryabhattai]MBE5102243.1 acetyl-CoA carboxylase carboxyltransferase subunit beta [Priestia aryabhattai]